MSIVNCVNNWYFSCVLITIGLGDNQLSICDLLIKKSFIMSRKGWRMDTVQCCMWWQDQNCDELKCPKASNLVIIYKLQSVWAYYLGYHLRVQLVLLRFFFAVRLSRLVLTLCNLEQYEVDTILCDIVKTLHVIVGFLLSVILFANQNFLDDFSNWLYCLILLKDFAFKHTIVRRDSVWEKSSLKW
jgi:hypothetical protein